MIDWQHFCLTAKFSRRGHLRFLFKSLAIALTNAFLWDRWKAFLQTSKERRTRPVNWASPLVSCVLIFGSASGFSFAFSNLALLQRRPSVSALTGNLGAEPFVFHPNRLGLRALFKCTHRSVLEDHYWVLALLDRPLRCLI
jgi:hypothetical protein